MKQLIWFDKEEFVAKLVRDFLAPSGFESYTPENFEDFVYIVEDLSPEFMVVDWESVEKNPQHFFSQIENSNLLKNLPLIMVIPDVQHQNWSPFVEKLNLKGTILKPIKIESLGHILTKILQN